MKERGKDLQSAADDVGVGNESVRSVVFPPLSAVERVLSERGVGGLGTKRGYRGDRSQDQTVTSFQGFPAHDPLVGRPTRCTVFEPLRPCRPAFGSAGEVTTRRTERSSKTSKDLTTSVTRTPPVRVGPHLPPHRVTCGPWSSPFRVRRVRRPLRGRLGEEVPQGSEGRGLRCTGAREPAPPARHAVGCDPRVLHSSPRVSRLPRVLHSSPRVGRHPRVP